MTATWRASDVRVSDLMLGVLIAAAILLCAATLLLHAGFTRPAVAASEQEPAPAVTVQAVEGRGNGGEPEAPSEPEPEVAEPPSEVEPELPRVLEQMIEDLPAEPEVEPPRERRPKRRARSVVASTAAVQGTPGIAGDGSSAGSGEGIDDGEALVSRYRTMLRQWLAAHVRLRDTGLAATELDGKRIRITLEIDHARTVTNVEIVPTGTTAFDRAVLEAVTALEGETLPEPPEGYPGPLQRRIPAVFVCNPGACR